MEQLALHSGKILALALLIGMSISFRLLLQLLGQRWITTTAHTATLVLLPILTYVITNVISGNIALSLGMVGALSIVRFRNPVRSPLELSVYFGAITMGIAASVSVMWLLFLALAVFLAIFVLVAFQIASLSLLKRPFFTASFSEGNSLSSLEISASEEIESIDKSRFLTVKRGNNKQVEYVLTSADFQYLIEVLDSIKTDSRITNYQLNS